MTEQTETTEIKWYINVITALCRVKPCQMILFYAVLSNCATRIVFCTENWF
nr:IncF plasmid conjugative transfer protein TrbD [Escherichia coli]